MYDVAKIDERFGLRPDQMVDYKALKGDPTDNIPGVPGVGEKTAAKLIRDFGDLDTLLARLDEVTPAKLGDKLREHVDQILMGRELSRIVRDLPIEIDLEAARLGDYDRDTVVRLFREYEFRTLIERLPPMAGESRRAAVRGAPGGRRRAATCRRPASPGGPDGWGAVAGADAGRERRAPAPPRLRHGDQRGAARRRRGDATAPAHDRNGDRRAPIEPAGDLPTALAAAIVDPGRIEVRGAGPDRRARRLDRRPARRRRVARRRRPATPPRHAARVRRRRRGRPGRRRRGRGGVRRPAPSRRGVRHAARRARGEADPRRPLRGRPGGPGDPGRVRHADRRLHPERRPAQPDDRRRRRREPRPDPAAGDRAARDRPRRASRRCRRSRSASRSSGASPRSGSTACSATSSCR